MVSGINHGSNLGDDITYSGTVAAALEGIMLGVPGIAVSQQSQAREMDFRLGERFEFAAAARSWPVVDRSTTCRCREGTLLNINVPGRDPDGVEVARLGKRIYRDSLDSSRRRTAGGASGSTATARPRRRAGHRPRRGLGGPDLGHAAALRPHRRSTAWRPCARTTSRRCWSRPPRRSPSDAVRRGRSRAAELREQLAHHGHRYYVLDDPEIGDDAYDALLDELRALEREHPELLTPDSPTQRVGGEPVSSLRKVDHLQPMLSLANARTEEELRAWVTRMRAHLAREGIEDPALRFVAEPKIDGLAISLLYRDGVLERGATRGNGEVGEDVTHNLRTVGAIPLQSRGAPPLLEVRGEVYMSLPDFAALNERRAEAGLSTFMNPRNSAAGTIRQLDPALAAERPLTMWCYGIGVTEGLELGSHWEALEWLRAHGFRVNGDVERLDSEDEVVARCLAWQERRGALDFEIDGVVVKVDDFELQRRLGVVGPRPALGDRLEVPADHGRHDAARGALERRQVRRPAPVRRARAGPRRRRDREDRDAAQRGGPRAQGRPRRATR